MFAQPVTYQSYDNEPFRIGSSLNLDFWHILVKLEFLELDNYET